MQLFDGQTADGSSADFRYVGDNANGILNLYISGALGGGTLTLEARLPDGSGYVPVEAFTATGMHMVRAASFVGRVTLSGATTPSVSAWIEGDTGQRHQAVNPA